MKKKIAHIFSHHNPTSQLLLFFLIHNNKYYFKRYCNKIIFPDKRALRKIDIISWQLNNSWKILSLIKCHFNWYIATSNGVRTFQKIFLFLSLTYATFSTLRKLYFIFFWTELFRDWWSRNSYYRAIKMGIMKSNF